MDNHYRAYKVRKPISIQSLVTVHYFEFAPSFTEQFEQHDFWELVYIDKGEILIKTNSDAVALQQGNMYLHKPEELHMLQGINSKSANVLIVSFVYEGEHLNCLSGHKIAVKEDLLHYLYTIIQEASWAFSLPFNDPFMKELTPIDCAVFGSEQMVVNSLEMFLIGEVRIETQSQFKMPLIREEVITDPVVLKIISFLRENIGQKITLADVCEKFKYSQANLSKRFRRICNSSIMNYHTILKINEAKRLIRETDYTFSEIAQLLAFCDAQHFSNCFRRVTNMSPMEYYKSVRPNNMRQNAKEE